MMLYSTNNPPPEGYIWCKRMSWGTGVADFLREPNPYYIDVFAYIDARAKDLLVDYDLEWMSKHYKQTISHGTMTRLLTVRTEWSRK